MSVVRRQQRQHVAKHRRDLRLAYARDHRAIDHRLHVFVAKHLRGASEPRRDVMRYATRCSSDR